MGRLLARLPFTSGSTGSILGFEREGGGHRAEWDRYLTLEGKRAYHIGNVCETCAFFFERLSGANHTVSPATVSEELRCGLTSLYPRLVEDVALILPAGEYEVMLLAVSPRPVAPGSGDDYFAAEQVALWGVDPFWGLPHHPKVPYYRTATVEVGDGGALFEFVVPMVPRGRQGAEGVASYRRQLEAGVRPTALALSVLDVKQPADWQEGTAVTAHWCLAHYLLDGHHKMAAAAEAGAPITLLSYLALGESIATREEVTQALATLERAP